MIRLALLRPIALAVVLAASAAPLGGQTPTVAVVPFDNGGSYGQEQADFDALRQAIGALVGSEVGRRSAARLIDRNRVIGAMKELGLSATDRLDASTVAKLGQATGATIAIAGTFIDLYGDFRIDARIVEVASGKVIKLVRSDPKLSDRAQMLRIIESLAERVVEAAGLASTGASPRPAAVSPTSITTFGKALLAEDAGDRAQAAALFRQASAGGSEFPEARAGLSRVGGSD